MKRTENSAGKALGAVAGLRLIALGLGLLVGVPAGANAQRIVNPAISMAPGPNEGKRPAGWLIRNEPTEAGSKDTIHFSHRGKGYHVQSGPPALVWSPKNVARGTFILESITFSGPSGATLPDGFGVFLGGKNMETPAAQYTEFLVRNDSYYAVLQHNGPKVVKLIDWTRLAGINIHSGRRDESVRNTFRVIVDDKTVQLVINRTLATTFLRSTFQPDGLFGVRIGAKQRMQLETLGLEKPVRTAAK